MNDVKIINGDKEVFIVKDKYSGLRLGVCTNGFQTTSVHIDLEIIKMIKQAIDKFMED